jgi:hypothetical protein
MSFGGNAVRGCGVEGKLFNFEKKCPRMNKVKPKFICTLQLPILICAEELGDGYSPSMMFV